jgi:two-component system, NtrC family, nitrogen regulation sensor histidine kinase NtrY
LKLSTPSLRAFFLAMVWLALLVWVGQIVVVNKGYYDLNAEAEKINTAYLELEEQILAYISEPQVTEKLITDAYTFDEFQQLCALPFGLAVYQGDSAAMWTSNAIIPVNANMGKDDQALFISEQNGSYVLYQHLHGKDIRIMAFLPLQTEFGINNIYLNDIQSDGIHIPAFFTLQSNEQQGAFPIINKDLQTVFYLVPDANATLGVQFPEYMIWPVLLLLVLSLLLIYELFLSVGKALGHIQRGILLLFMLSAGYAIMHYGARSFLASLAVFDPGVYASGVFASSLGDLFVRCSIILLLVYHIVRKVERSFFDNNRKYLLFALLLAILAALLFVGNSLVQDSAIIFDVNELFSLDRYSLIAFICIAMLCLSAGLVGNRLITTMGSRHLNNALVFSILIILFFFFFKLSTGAYPMRFLYFACGIVLVLFLLNWIQIRPASLIIHLVWLLVFSFITAIVISSAVNNKTEENKQLFAFKKSVEKDALAEFLFQEQQEEILRLINVQLTQSGNNEGVIRQGLINQLRQQLQANYFKKYDAEIYLFKNSEFVVGSGQQEQPTIAGFVDAIEYNGAYTAAPNLYFINDYTGNYYYLADLQLPINEDEISLYILLLPRKFNSESLYPELLVDDELRLPKGFEGFNYAIYYNNNLVERKGEYSYPVMDVFYVPKGKDWVDVEINGYDHFVYVVNDTKKVVVSDSAEDVSRVGAYFSFLFFFYLLFYVVLVAVHLLLTQRELKGLLSLLETSMKNKIQLAIVSLVMSTFLALGAATVVYITRQYNQTNRKQLLEKIEAVQTNIDYLYADNRRGGEQRNLTTSNIRKITSRISELSEVHDMDINLYNRNGILIAASQPDIFDKGLISAKMNPLAYFKMTCDKETWYIHNESIGKLEFLSAYVPVMDDAGEVLFYLNLPYFATEKDLQAEISSFLIALINVYVLLLLIAAIIALIVSRNITGPLTTIAGTFKSIQLGRKNEPIAWPHQDEIGLLVDAYNDMLLQLETSAKLLANTERESAWRDMAKQVAHEIKNPLTPMRLSIQHLQRAISDKRPDIDLLTARVARTMMEQIDNLSFIASEFSNFAVMPKAQNETIEMAALLRNVGELFHEQDGVQITLQLEGQELIIYADRNQVLRVFNNLVKNAIQAIPEEQEGAIIIGARKEGERILCYVQDNGKGIADSFKDQVFVPNFTTKSSGMGIGLALSKSIIESAGGSIWFESQEGEGTTFYVAFPASSEDQP